MIIIMIYVGLRNTMIYNDRNNNRYVKLINTMVYNDSNNNRYVNLDNTMICNDSNKPGIFSARYAKDSGGWAMAMENLYKEVIKKKSNDFSAKFVCSLTIRINNNYFALKKLIKEHLICN